MQTTPSSHPATWHLRVSIFLTGLVVALFFILIRSYPSRLLGSYEHFLAYLAGPYIIVIIFNFLLFVIIARGAGKSRETLLSLVALMIGLLPAVLLFLLSSQAGFWYNLRTVESCELHRAEFDRAVCTIEMARGRNDRGICARITSDTYRGYCDSLFQP